MFEKKLTCVYSYIATLPVDSIYIAKLVIMLYSMM